MCAIDLISVSLYIFICNNRFLLEIIPHLHQLQLQFETMNTIRFFALQLAIYACVIAEPLQFRQRLVDETKNSDVSYPASGWKPVNGQFLQLPRQRLSRPNDIYGPPPLPVTTETQDESEFSSTPSTIDEESTTSNASDVSEQNDITEEPESESIDIEELPAQRQSNGNPFVQSPNVQLIPLPRYVYYYTPYISTPHQQNTNKIIAGGSSRFQSEPLFYHPIVLPNTVGAATTSYYQRW